MLRKERTSSYQQFIDEDEDEDEGNGQSPDFLDDATDDLEHDELDDLNNLDEPNEFIKPNEQHKPNGSVTQAEEDIRTSGLSMRFSKTCLKNVFTVVLIFIYLLLTAVAAFLAYQTISDFFQKLHNPVMSVTYDEVDSFPPPGIVVFPGRAQLLSCRHHNHDYIPPLVDPGKPQESDCEILNVTYIGPFKNETEKKAMVVRGPSDVKNKELIFMQFSHNETEEDFSAISYMLFANFSDLKNSANKSKFMRQCERNHSIRSFSGGFRTWVKMSLVKTSGRNTQAVEFREESAVVKFNDKRPQSERTNQLFFAVFEWRDPFVQEIRLIVTANAWNSVAILCGVFMALFKAANFAKLAIQWIIKMRKRHLRNKLRELNQMT